MESSWGQYHNPYEQIFYHCDRCNTYLRSAFLYGKHMELHYYDDLAIDGYINQVVDMYIKSSYDNWLRYQQNVAVHLRHRLYENIQTLRLHSNHPLVAVNTGLSVNNTSIPPQEVHPENATDARFCPITNQPIPYLHLGGIANNCGRCNVFFNSPEELIQHLKSQAHVINASNALVEDVSNELLNISDEDLHMLLDDNQHIDENSEVIHCPLNGMLLAVTRNSQIIENCGADLTQEQEVPNEASGVSNLQSDTNGVVTGDTEQVNKESENIEVE